MVLEISQIKVFCKIIKEGFILLVEKGSHKLFVFEAKMSK
jgi:predicted RNA binding protein YcfA (HicA-like mRNA interferase family)